MVFADGLGIDATDRTLAYLPYSVHAKRTYANVISDRHARWRYVHRAEYAHFML